MRITDNLKKDIHGAPEWFLEAINVEPKEKYIENPKGNIAYSKWSNKRDAEAVSYTHLTLPTTPYV